MKNAIDLRNITKQAQARKSKPLLDWARDYVESCSETLERAAALGYTDVTIEIKEEAQPEGIRWKFSNKEKQLAVAEEFANFYLKYKLLTDPHRINVSWAEEN